MSRELGPIEGFLSRVQGRLNRQRLWTTLIWAVVAASGALLAAGLWFTTRGYAVPGNTIMTIAALAAICLCLVTALRRFTADGAAPVADRFYRLHDAITSYLHFARAGHSEGYYALQAEQTRARVANLNPQDMKLQTPRRGVILAACLLAIGVPLSLRGPSERVLRERQLAEQTQLATAAINEQLEKQVEDLHEQTTGEEKELLDPNKLREWIKELQETTDHKEALRQYSELERKLTEARLAVQNKRDEQLLERAGRELAISRETQPLAEQLAQKNYGKAAEQLEKMAPQQNEQPLSKQRQELARLKAAAQHMAAAARASRESATSAKSASGAEPSASPSSASSSQSSGSSGSAKGASGNSGGGGGDMAEAMEELAQRVAQLDKSLEAAERQETQRGQCDAKQLGECQACKQGVSDELVKLCNGLKRLSICKSCDQKLCKLCQSCSQCQSNMASMCQSPNAGGKNAGSGTNTARRGEVDKLVDNGQTSSLQGMKGTGPSITSVEAAEDGSGVSSRQASERQRTFERQFESFVAREDVPDEVKDGVKHYFEVIHQIAPETASAETPSNVGNSN